MKTIWKFELDLTGDHPRTIDDGYCVRMPAGSKILRVGTQRPRVLAFWALVDPQELTDRDVPVHVYGTGHPVPDDAGVYLGGVDDGPFVWHVFAPSLDV